MKKFSWTFTAHNMHAKNGLVRSATCSLKNWRIICTEINTE